MQSNKRVGEKANFGLVKLGGENKVYKQTSFRYFNGNLPAVIGFLFFIDLRKADIPDFAAACCLSPMLIRV